MHVACVRIFSNNKNVILNIVRVCTFRLIHFFAVQTEKLALCPSFSQQTHSFIHSKTMTLKTHCLCTCIQLLKAFQIQLIENWTWKVLNSLQDVFQQSSTQKALLLPFWQKTKRRISWRMHFTKSKSNNIHE